MMSVADLERKLAGGKSSPEQDQQPKGKTKKSKAGSRKGNKSSKDRQQGGLTPPSVARQPGGLMLLSPSTFVAPAAGAAAEQPMPPKTPERRQNIGVPSSAMSMQPSSPPAAAAAAAARAIGSPSGVPAAAAWPDGENLSKEELRDLIVARLTDGGPLLDEVFARYQKHKRSGDLAALIAPLSFQKEGVHA